MTAAPARRYGGLTQETRRELRRERLLDAALDQVGDGGVSSLTVGAICDRAGLAKRYFYESFDSVDDVVSAALARIFEQVSQALNSVDHDTAASPTQRNDAAASPEQAADSVASPEQVLDVAVRAALDAMDDSRAARLYLESGGTPAAAATRERAVDLLVDQLLGQVVGPGRQSESARLIGHLLVSGATHVVALWLRGELKLPREEVVRLLVELGSAAAVRLRADALGDV